jgi:hypothetical protein
LCCTTTCRVMSAGFHEDCMAKQERFTEMLRCPECGLQAEVAFAELETATSAHGRLNARIVSLPEGFERGQRQDDVVCASCQVLIPR